MHAKNAGKNYALRATKAPTPFDRSVGGNVDYFLLPNSSTKFNKKQKRQYKFFGVFGVPPDFLSNSHMQRYPSM